MMAGASAKTQVSERHCQWIFCRLEYINKENHHKIINSCPLCINFTIKFHKYMSVFSLAFSKLFYLNLTLAGQGKR